MDGARGGHLDSLVHDDCDQSPDIVSEMNLFKRARSTTGRGAPASDTSRTTLSTADPVGTKSAIPVHAPANFSLSAPTPSVERNVSYRGDDDVGPPRHRYSFVAHGNHASTSGLAPPQQQSSRATIQNIYHNHTDLYAQNNLDSFVFGTAPPAAASRLEPPPSVSDDPDSDEASLIPDTTPRPSVVGGGGGGEHQGARHPHQSRLAMKNYHKSSSISYVGPLPAEYNPKPETDSASVCTFGAPSASESTLPTGPPQPSRRLSSRISSYSSSTPHTSGNDITSSEEEDTDNKHPPSSDADEHPWMSFSDRQSPLFLSEDELDNYDDEVDNDRDGIYDSHATRRKGSAAIPISSPGQDNHRNQECSAISLRRGSRSLDEIHSLSHANPMGSTSPSIVVHSGASSSVPQSEGEIENVRKKSLPPISPMGVNTHGSANAGIDSSWMENWGRTGITGFNCDDMADIVGGLSHSPSVAYNTTRRHSTFSTTTVDIMLRNIQAWNSGSQKYQDQRKLWVFEKETPDPLAPSRERLSLSSFFSPRSSGPNEASSNLVAPFLDHGYTQKEREKKPSKEHWKGMPLDTEEYWINGWSGRFKVIRKNTRNERDSVQQRLIFSHVHNQDGIDRIASGRPFITIHKHSKVIGFSIGRSYRHRKPNSAAIGSSQTSRPQPQSDRKKQPILLAPRRIQVSYTSTTTTRKLESHGLLSEDGRKNAKDLARMERLKKEQDLEVKRLQKEKEKERLKGKVIERAAKTFSGKGKEPSIEAEAVARKAVQKIGPPNGPAAISVRHPASFEIYEGNSSSPSGKASVNNSSSTSAVTTPDPGDSSTLAEGQSIAATSDRTAIIGRDNFFRRRGSALQNYEQYNEDDEDDSDDCHRRRPQRSTYRETYATLPPEVFGTCHHEPVSNRLFGWGRSRAADRLGPLHYLEVSYVPPWLTQPKNSSITRQDIVEDLNMSFQDVGLLPAIGEIKTSARSKHRREYGSKKVRTPALKSENHIDIFAHIPDDTLCMLLPLWPGETEPSSAKRYPFTPPVIPANKRLYLLVIYKALPSGSPEDKSSKKKYKNALDGQDDRCILLNSFHISARVVSYDELQGSCIRIPDQGLAISGPLQEAYDTMPNFQQKEQYIIGVCPNRDSGFEFMPEGFEKMGLSHNVPNPRLMETFTDDDTSSMDTLAVPTPIGHAVMEMAWLGGMALTNFHRDAHWRG